MTGNKALEALRRTLRHKLKDAGEALSVRTDDLRAVLEELGRLQQSTDRLRRQNRRLRVRLQAAGVIDLAAEGEADSDEN
jgi:hypothetical protein